MKIQSKIIRSNRRSIALEIHPNATLIIRAPWFITKHAIENFIQKKHSWIEKKMRIAKARSQVSPKKFITNEIFSYLGKSYQLKIDDKIKPTPSVISDKLVISTKQSAKASKILTSWYKEQARQYFVKKAQYYSVILGVKYKQIRVTSAKKRWGSCSHKGNISFSWRLIMATPSIIDYVIVHELAHLREYNHSKKFWQFVAKIIPYYKEQRKWLKDNGYTLIV